MKSKKISFLPALYKKYAIETVEATFHPSINKKAFIETFLKDYSPDYQRLKNVQHENDIPDTFLINVDPPLHKWEKLANSTYLDFQYTIQLPPEPITLKPVYIHGILNQLHTYISHYVFEGVELEPDYQYKDEFVSIVHEFLPKEITPHNVNQLISNLLEKVGPVQEIPNEKRIQVSQRMSNKSIFGNTDELENSNIYKEISHYKTLLFENTLKKIQYQKDCEYHDLIYYDAEDKAMFTFHYFFEEHLKPRRTWLNTIFRLSLPIDIG